MCARALPRPADRQRLTLRPMAHSNAELRDIALAAAQAGAATIREWTSRGDAIRTEVKGRADYVTAVDRAAEVAVLDVLRVATPDIAILAEESGGERHERMWVVDPLDGTTNFVRGFHVAVGVSVGLMVDGLPVAGAVVAPFAGQQWTAAAGAGAFDGAGRRLDISAGSGEGVVATGFPFRRAALRERYLGAFHGALETFEDIRRAGAASLDCANTAAGVWEGYFELSLSLWDIAAGALLVREAGGVVSDWQGDERAVYNSGDIVCGSPAWHERMLGIIAAAAAEATP